MKKFTKKFSILIALLLYFFVVVSGLPEILIGHASDLEVKESNTVENEVAISLDESNYKYTEPERANFYIEAIEGNAVLENDNICLTFNETEVIIPCFDFYRLLDTQNEVMFYQADVAKDISINESYAYIAAMPNRYGIYELFVHYGVEENRTLYMIKAEMTEEMFDFIDAKANDLHIGDDEVSQRLKASSKAHMQGEHKIQSTISNQAGSNALKSINEHTYDNYTDSNELIYAYAKQDMLTPNKTSEGYTTDDSIVRIIPKELFSIVGEHFYIGKEYGFFIKVTNEMAFQVSYLADILVFDILHEIPSFPQNSTGTCKIIPLFNWRYQVREKSYSDWYGYDPSLSQIVTNGLDYNQAELFLDDIGIKISIENPDALNTDDNNYNSIEDDGAFIIQTRVNAQGVGLKKKKGSFLADTAICAFGFVPYASAALNIYSYISNLNEGFGNGGYLYSRSTTFSDNEANIETYETNNTDQINQRGHLIKSKAVTIKSDADAPRLINVGGYAEIKYVVARRSGSNYSKMRIITSVSANVLEDNTFSPEHFLHWWDKGEVVNYGRATGTYELSKYKRLNNVTVEGCTTVSVPASKGYQMVKFVPKISGEYLFETISNVGDPHFSIKNATKNTDTVNATDDIDGANNRNARLLIDLIAGDTYYITTKSFNSGYGYKLRIGFNPTASDCLQKDFGYFMDIPSNTYKMVKFVPDATGYYDFFTDQSSGNPFIHLFNETGSMITNSDDGFAGGYDSLITAYLTAGTTYYIAGQGSYGVASNFYVYVVPSIEDRSQINLNSFLRLTVSKTVNVYRFVAPYSATYDFYTCDRVEGDPYLELYDYNRTKIAYNDDGNGDLNSIITVNLTAGEECYIHLTSLDNITSTYVFSIRLSIKNRTEIKASQDSSASVSIRENEVKIFKFVAQENRNYTIQTNKIISGDPYLQLMDSRGLILYEDDDGAGNFNSEINFTATAGEEYFIVCMGYDKGIRNQYNLIIK